MLTVKRNVVIAKLKKEALDSAQNKMIENIMKGPGDQAMAYLVKRREITFTREQLKEELNYMVEHNLLTIVQWEGMNALLDNTELGDVRVTNFMRRKRRIQVID